MDKFQKPSFRKFYRLSVELSPEIYRLLTEAADRSQRTRRKELVMILEEHLNNFDSVSTIYRYLYKE